MLHYRGKLLNLIFLYFKVYKYKQTINYLSVEKCILFDHIQCRGDKSLEKPVYSALKE